MARVPFANLDSSRVCAMSITSSDFPELGLPLYPVDMSNLKGLKMSADLKKDYKESYIPECESSLLDRSSFSECKMSSTSFSFEFDSGVHKTYRFLGMDIDEDFNAVICAPGGTVLVSNMYDCLADEVKTSVSEEAVRGLVTYLKVGGFRDMCKDDSANLTFNRDSYNKIADALSLESNTPVTEFTSAILYLVHDFAQAKKLERNTSGSDMGQKSMLLASIFGTWREVIEKYNHMFTVLSAVDLWCDIYKRFLGEKVFYSRLRGVCTIASNSTEPAETEVFNFSGISRDQGMWDDNTTRVTATGELARLRALYKVSVTDTSKIEESCKAIEPRTLLYSCVDDTGIDIEESVHMSPDELQAFSILDTLQYTDEDATLVRQSYNMNEPEERASFVRSAIHAYERNFKEYKVMDEVPESIGDTVERMSGISAFTDPNSVTSVVGDGERTLQGAEIDALRFKKNMLKVLRVLEKALQKAAVGFN